MLAKDGVQHLAMEASSHGLDQFRLDGVRIAAAGFTNITRDHLDYHPDFAHYLAAKLRLVTELVAPAGLVCINADGAHAAEFIAAARGRGLQIVTVGAAGGDLTLTRQDAHADGQTLGLRYGGQPYEIALPLAGSFQAGNALVAAGIAIGLGDPHEAVLAALERLDGVPGRLERVARKKNGAPVYVDYAHTPDALETILKALRPHVAGKLVCVFGCGGDRDRGKRPLMGAIAMRLADHVIVTDDNPRTEEAAAIRKEILVAAPGAREIGDRAAAIRAAVDLLESGDLLVIAGKGHEEGQIVGTEVHPFSDRDQAIAAVRERSAA
jgi:UDP-N-acetylmuramoyl-L-alanyl-D-glutamate--2,6-diaminopimelate ligase